MVECVNKCVKCGIVLIKLSPRPIIGQTGGKSFPFWVSVDTGQTICKKNYSHDCEVDPREAFLVRI